MINLFKKERAFAIGSCVVIWQVLFFYLPLSLLLLSSVVVISDSPGLFSLTLQNFVPLFTRAHFNIIFHSLILGFSTVFLTLIFSYPLAYIIAFKIKKFKNLLLFFLIIPFLTNFLLHIYAWFFVLETEGFLNIFLLKIGLITQPLHFLNSPIAMMIMMVYYYFPFMLLPIYFALEKFDKRLMEASNDLGASWRQTFKQIILPLTLPAVRTGILLVLIPSFGEFIIPDLMGGDKHYFVGNVIVQYILGGETGGMGAAFTIMSSAALFLSIILIIKGTKIVKRGQI